MKSGIDIEFEVIKKRPDFEALDLESEAQDDNLLASVLTFKDANPDLPVILVSGDFGITLKARIRQIDSIILPEELKSTFDLDEDEKRIKELEKENLEFRNRMPKLNLYFSSTKTDNICLTRKKRLIPLDFNEDEMIDKWIEEAKEQYPKLKEVQAEDHPPLSTSFEYPFRPARHPRQAYEISQYNESLEKYFKDLREYYSESISWDKYDERSFLLDIEISNNGTCPAEDIRVYMHCPENFMSYEFTFFSSYSRREKPKPPSPPTIEKRNSENVFDNFGKGKTSTLNILPSDMEGFNRDGTSIDIEKLNQYTSQKLYDLAISFDSFDQISNFQIHYEIIASNLTRPLKGELHIRFE